MLLLSLILIIIRPLIGLAFSISSSQEGSTSFSVSSSSQLDNPLLGRQICSYHTITINPSGNDEDTAAANATGPPRQQVSIEDLTPTILSLLKSSNMRHGVIHVISKHTTTAITINEYESRLGQDIANYFLNICPPDERCSSLTMTNDSSKYNNKLLGSGVRYLHNDIHLRPEGNDEVQRCLMNGWDITNPKVLQQWRDQEPINAHSHLLSMMLGSSECIPVVDGTMVIGQWQSVLLVDFDGPRIRTVGVQLMGYE